MLWALRRDAFEKRLRIRICGLHHELRPIWNPITLPAFT